jgi:hypothetical protein
MEGGDQGDRKGVLTGVEDGGRRPESEGQRGTRGSVELQQGGGGAGRLKARRGAREGSAPPL